MNNMYSAMHVYSMCKKRRKATAWWWFGIRILECALTNQQSVSCVHVSFIEFVKKMVVLKFTVKFSWLYSLHSIHLIYFYIFNFLLCLKCVEQQRNIKTKMLSFALLHLVPSKVQSFNSASPWGFVFVWQVFN